MDFDILVPGHGKVGEKADVKAIREYMEHLRKEVLIGLRSGKNLESTKAAIDLSYWRDWGQFDNWSGQNIDGMYQRLQLNRRDNP